MAFNANIIWLQIYISKTNFTLEYRGFCRYCFVFASRSKRIFFYFLFLFCWFNFVCHIWELSHTWHEWCVIVNMDGWPALLTIFCDLDWWQMTSLRNDWMHVKGERKSISEISNNSLYQRAYLYPKHKWIVL